MKKLKFLGLAAIAAGMVSLTSCLDGGGNSSTGGGFGVVDFDLDAMGNVVKDDYGTKVYSTGFANLNPGEYVMYYCSIDWDAQPSSKYITASVGQGQVAKFDKWSTDSYITDTASVLPNEIAMSKVGFVQTPINNVPYVLRANSHVFVTSTLKNMPSDQVISYDLSYDGALEPVQVEGVNVYDFYLRATKVGEGKKTEQDIPVVNVFDFNSFLNRAISKERAAGAKVVNVRLNYIKEFSKDSTSWEWDKSDIAPFPIPSES